MSFPTPLVEEETYLINGQPEIVISFSPDRVEPASRDADEDQYTLAKERLHSYGYVVVDIDDNTMQIYRPHSIYYTSTAYCRTDMLVGMSKCTKEDFDFAECIRSCFREAYIANAKKE
jgi:hypothetical protein